MNKNNKLVEIENENKKIIEECKKSLKNIMIHSKEIIPIQRSIIRELKEIALISEAGLNNIKNEQYHKAYRTISRAARYMLDDIKWSGDYTECEYPYGFDKYLPQLKD